MRVTKEEIQRIFRKMEDKYNLKRGKLSEIYRAEADVVFMGRRRSILKDIRRIVRNAQNEETE